VLSLSATMTLITKVKLSDESAMSACSHVDWAISRVREH